jgi:hypothetical protein
MSVKTRKNNLFSACFSLFTPRQQAEPHKKPLPEQAVFALTGSLPHKTPQPRLQNRHFYRHICAAQNHRMRARAAMAHPVTPKAVGPTAGGDLNHSLSTPSAGLLVLEAQHGAPFPAPLREQIRR